MFVRRLVSCRLTATGPARAASTLNQSLQETDPEIFNLIEHEKRRQRDSLVRCLAVQFAFCSAACESATNC